MNKSRPTCWQCIRPKSHCHCKLLSPFLAHSNTVILQHPRERKRFYSTAKLITQWISNCELVRGIEFSQNDILDLFPGTQLAVLFPSKNSSSAGNINLSESNTVILIDGTWSEANKIYRENPWIANLPHISLSTTLHSNYRIRKQPRSECLSTIEALAYMFIENCSVAKKETKPYINLLNGFKQMVDTHLESVPADIVAYYDQI